MVSLPSIAVIIVTWTSPFSPFIKKLERWYFHTAKYVERWITFQKIGNLQISELEIMIWLFDWWPFQRVEKRILAVTFSVSSLICHNSKFVPFLEQSVRSGLGSKKTLSMSKFRKAYRWYYTIGFNFIFITLKAKDVSLKQARIQRGSSCSYITALECRVITGMPF